MHNKRIGRDDVLKIEVRFIVDSTRSTYTKLTNPSGREHHHLLAGDLMPDEMAVAAEVSAHHAEVAAHVALHAAAATKMSENAIGLTTVIVVIVATAIGLAALMTVSAIQRTASAKTSIRVVMLLLATLIANASPKTMSRASARTASLAKVC
jgi:hypothetical protein